MNPSSLDCHWSKFSENFDILLGTGTPPLWIAIDWNSQIILMCCWGLKPQTSGLPLVNFFLKILMWYWGLEPQFSGLALIKILRKFWCDTGALNHSPLDCQQFKFSKNFNVPLGTQTPGRIEPEFPDFWSGWIDLGSSNFWLSRINTRCPDFWHGSIELVLYIGRIEPGSLYFWLGRIKCRCPDFWPDRIKLGSPDFRPSRIKPGLYISGMAVLNWGLQSSIVLNSALWLS